MLKFSSWSLLKKSLFGLNIICAILLVSASLIGFNHLSRKGKADLETKVNSLGGLFRHGASRAFWNFDMDVLKLYSQQLIEDKDVAAVEFFDKDNKLVSNAQSVDPKDLPFIERKVSAPNNADNIIGSLKIYYSFAEQEKELKRTLGVLLLASLCFQVLLSFLMYFFLGQSSKRLEKSVGQLKETAEQTRTTGFTLKELSSEISKKGATQAAAVEETSATLSEISSLLSNTVKSSEQAFKAASASYEFAIQGQSENQALASAMTEISEGATKIQEIIAVVDDIAFQTNILALNAAVEAARAGEHGRGFAVVAEAVRSLAQKSAAAAKDISDLIEESTHRVQKGKSLVESNYKLFQEILKSAQEVKNSNEQLLNSTQEQSHGINSITQTMHEIDQAVNDSAHSTNQAANHADSMAQQSELLNQVVVNFEKEIKGESKKKHAA